MSVAVPDTQRTRTQHTHPSCSPVLSFAFPLSACRIVRSAWTLADQVRKRDAYESERLLEGLNLAQTAVGNLGWTMLCNVQSSRHKKRKCEIVLDLHGSPQQGSAA